MKLGRNDPCSCGSGRKYKHCCISNPSKMSADIADDVEKVVAMNPTLTLDDADSTPKCIKYQAARAAISCVIKSIGLLNSKTFRGLSFNSSSTLCNSSSSTNLKLVFLG
jgi:hypothetical protein